MTSDFPEAAFLFQVIFTLKLTAFFVTGCGLPL